MLSKSECILLLTKLLEITYCLRTFINLVQRDV